VVCSGAPRRKVSPDRPTTRTVNSTTSSPLSNTGTTVDVSILRLYYIVVDLLHVGSASSGIDTGKVYLYSERL